MKIEKNHLISSLIVIILTVVPKVFLYDNVKELTLTKTGIAEFFLLLKTRQRDVSTLNVVFSLFVAGNATVKSLCRPVCLSVCWPVGPVTLCSFCIF